MMDKWQLDPEVFPRVLEDYQHFLDGVNYDPSTAPKGFDEAVADYGAAVLMTLLAQEECAFRIIGGSDFPEDETDYPLVVLGLPSELFPDDKQQVGWAIRPLIDVLRDWLSDTTLTHGGDRKEVCRAHLAALKHVVAQLEAENVDEAASA